MYADLSAWANAHYFAALQGVRKPPPRTVRWPRSAWTPRTPTGWSAGCPADSRPGVSLACAPLARPELLVLDEPTVGLDPVLRRDLWQFFHELADGGATLLISSHVDEAACATSCC